MRKLTEEQVAAFRLRGHHLSGRAPAEDIVDVVGSSGGIQAQQMNPARLSMRARTRGLTPERVDGALWEDHSLVRLWAMRQCVHIIPMADLPLYVAALGTSLSRINRGWMEREGLDNKMTGQLMEAVLEALDGGPMTRDELGPMVASSVGPEHARWVTSSWGGVLTRGCYQGEIVFGPPKGQKTTFMRRDQVMSGWDPPEEREAREELVRRYLHAYGPARVQDFVAWSATTVREFKPVWEAMGGELVPLEMEGREVRMLPDDYELASSLDPGGLVVNLLGNFDTFLLGHKERTQVVDERFRRRVFRAAGWVYPVVLVNGRALGNWSAKTKAGGVTIEVEHFVRLPRGTRSALRREAEDLGRYWDTRVSVVYR